PAEGEARAQPRRGVLLELPQPRRDGVLDEPDRHRGPAVHGQRPQPELGRLSPRVSRASGSEGLMSRTPLRTLRRAAAAAAAAAVLHTAPAPRAQESAADTAAPENLKAREWFQEARFGLFVHWGVYSLLGDGEWVLNNQRIRLEEYEKLP